MDHEDIKLKRRTNDLVRLCYTYLRKKKRIDAEAIYHLTRLTWITNSGNNSWLNTVRKPSLSFIFSEDFRKLDNQAISTIIAHKAKLDFTEVIDIIDKSTGFTNAYLAYRNSYEGWLKTSDSKCIKLCNLVYHNRTNNAYLGATEDRKSVV